MLDLEDELEKLGFGNQWDAVCEKLSSYRELVKARDLARLLEHNRAYPEKQRAAIKRWREKRLEETKHLLGSNCILCNKKLSPSDLAYSIKVDLICAKCRKVKK